MNRFSPIATVVACLLLFSACTGEQAATIDSGTIVDPIPSESSASDGQDSSLLDDRPIDPYFDSSTRAVVLADDLAVLAAPDGAPLTTLSATTDFGTTRVLLVEQELGDWVKVRLPARPNHHSGWVSANDVRLESVDLEVFVDLATRTLSLYENDELLVRSAVAIGSDDNPTPTGTFYITDKLETSEADGPYGPYALGLSGFSETLTEFAGGAGQIGIHGTDQADSIGEAVSHGCIRLPNELIEALATLVPLGTPVHVV